MFQQLWRPSFLLFLPSSILLSADKDRFGSRVSRLTPISSRRLKFLYRMLLDDFDLMQNFEMHCRISGVTATVLNWSLIFLVSWTFVQGYFWFSCQGLRTDSNNTSSHCAKLNMNEKKHASPNSTSQYC